MACSPLLAHRGSDRDSAPPLDASPVPHRASRPRSCCSRCTRRRTRTARRRSPRPGRTGARSGSRGRPELAASIREGGAVTDTQVEVRRRCERAVDTPRTRRGSVRYLVEQQSSARDSLGLARASSLALGAGAPPALAAPPAAAAAALCLAASAAAASSSAATPATFGGVGLPRLGGRSRLLALEQPAAQLDGAPALDARRLSRQETRTRVSANNPATSSRAQRAGRGALRSARRQRRRPRPPCPRRPAPPPPSASHRHT